MKMKFEARSTSDEYVEEAAEDMVFIKHFGQYISKKELIQILIVCLFTSVLILVCKKNT